MPETPVTPSSNFSSQPTTPTLHQVDFLRWDCKEVSNWIYSLSFPSHVADSRPIAELFTLHNIDGSLLPHLSTAHLKEIGIDNLSIRLFIKKEIAQLICDHHVISPYIELNDNHVQFESLQLTSTIVNSIVSQINSKIEHNTALLASPRSVDSELKRINDNFNRLKNDLLPVMKLVKETKPLPTPDRPQSSYFSPVDKSPSHSSIATLTASPTHTSFNTLNSNANRMSSGSVISMGTGKIVQQSVMKPEISRMRSDSKTNSIPSPSFLNTSSSSKVKLIPPSSGVTGSPSPTYPTKTVPQHPPLQRDSSSSTLTKASTVAPATAAVNSEPLKQLRASSEDSCHKVLQQAMKRHHISRDDWGKYVLVICYGNRERILKLDEKPVLIFRELQELGKHPAIMLRQLASESGEDHDDARIGDEIPGGRL